MLDDHACTPKHYDLGKRQVWMKLKMKLIQLKRGESNGVNSLRRESTTLCISKKHLLWEVRQQAGANETADHWLMAEFVEATCYEGRLNKLFQP